MPKIKEAIEYLEAIIREARFEECSSIEIMAEQSIRLLEPMQEEINRLTAENQKLNIILFHRENGLAHMDLNPEIMVSKIAELKAEIDRWKERYDNLDQRYNGYEVGNANLAEQIDRLTAENQKLNIILFHRENNGQR